MPTLNRQTRASDTPRFLLRTLGRLELHRIGADAPEVVTRQAKPLALVAYLAHGRERTATRDRLLTLLWDSPRIANPGRALTQAQFQVNRLAGAELIRTDGPKLVLTELALCDTEEFERAIAEGRASEAVELYAGDFWPAVRMEGSSGFEQWSDSRRESLRDQFVAAARLVVQQRHAARDLVGCESLARRARDIHPASEAAWRLLLETLVAIGKRGTARTEGATLRRLARDQELEFSPALDAYLGSLDDAVSPALISPTLERPALDLPLVGRDEALAAFDEQWAIARGGCARAMHVVGASGVGKSRLLAEAVARLRTNGTQRRAPAAATRVVSIVTAPAGRSTAYALAGEVALALARFAGATAISPQSKAELVSLNPSLSTWFDEAPVARTDGESPRRRGQALRELVRAVVHDAPLALLIDDLHYADAESREVLSLAFGGLEGVPLLLVTAGRAQPAGELPGLANVQLPLTPLDAGDVRSLLSLLGQLPASIDDGDFVTQLWHATGGSPLEVRETLQLLVDRGTLTQRGGTWMLTSIVDDGFQLRPGEAVVQRLAQLPAGARAVLLHIAVSGLPLSTDELATVVGMDDAAVRGALTTLETRGFVSPRSGSWTVAHDALAAASVAAAEPDVLVASHRALARHLSERRHGREAALTAAARHAMAGNDWPLAASSFSQFVSSRRVRGDRRTNLALAREARGVDAGSDDVRRLVRSLPLSHRVGLYSTPRLAASALVALVASVGALAAAGAFRSPPPAPDQILVVLAQPGERERSMPGWRVPVRASAWEGSAVDISWRRQSPDYRFPAGNRALVQSHTATGEFVGHTATRDSGSIDVYAVSGAGDTTRLTAFRGDDGSPAASPDGRWLAFASDQWNGEARYDIALMDRRSGVARPLTRGPDADGPVIWKGDGTALAFVRRHWDDRPTTICQIGVDGGIPECLTPLEGAFTYVHGWYGQRQLIVTRSVGDLHTVEVVDVTRGSSRVLAEVRDPWSTSVSTDGRWISCRCALLGAPDNAYVVFPIGRPDAARVLSESKPGEIVGALWEHSPQTPYLERVVIESVDTLRVGVPHKLALALYDQRDRAIALGRVHWQIVGTGVASVDAQTGVVTPIAPGVAMVRVSVGGWREDSLPVVVAPPAAAAPLFSERWGGGLDAWWRRGTPLPGVVDDSLLGPSLLNNGDGSFDSGVITRQSFDPRSGLSLELAVRGRFARGQWQQLSVAFLADPPADVVASVDWTDDRAALVDRLPRCLVRIPEGVGGAAARITAQLGEVERNEHASWSLPRAVADGAPLEIRLQLLPDGRCGAVVGGQRAWISTGRLPTGRRVRVALVGSSVGTQVVAGPLTLRRGVIDQQFRTSRPAAAAAR